MTTAAAANVRTADDLRAWRARLGMSQRTLAQQLDVTLMTIYRWEAGKVDIPRTVQLALNYLESQPGQATALTRP